MCRIYRTDAAFHREEFFATDEIGLVDDDDISEGDLLLRLVLGLELRHQMFEVMYSLRIASPFAWKAQFACVAATQD